MANFAAIDDVEKFLQISITDADKINSVNRSLEEATFAIKNYTNQFLEFVSNETTYLDSVGGYRLTLPELPVINVSSVWENDELLIEAEDYKLGSSGVLYRIPVSGSRKWARGPQVIKVTYTHGFNTIPDDIKSVATRIAARSFQAGIRASSDSGVIGITSKSLGDYSVSYGGETGGGIGEGVMGASAARILLKSEMEILDKYKVKRIYAGV